jgi:ubiquinone/menaquinone biosynthesis C-methylase UbiE
MNLIGPLAAVTVLAAIVARRDLLVRTVRGLDRRGGLASRRGERAYAGASRLFAGLHRRVARDIAAVVGEREASVLDIGAGPGHLLLEVRSLAPRAALTGIEPSVAMRGIAADRGLEELEGRAEQLPLADASVNLVVSTLSMHHWDDPARAFAEIRRVLRPGGEAWIYDVRFAAYNDREVRAFALAAGLDPAAVHRRTLDEHLLGVRPYSLITIQVQETSTHAD